MIKDKIISFGRWILAIIVALVLVPIALNSSGDFGGLRPRPAQDGEAHSLPASSSYNKHYSEWWELEPEVLKESKLENTKVSLRKIYYESSMQRLQSCYEYKVDPPQKGFSEGSFCYPSLVISGKLALCTEFV